MTARERVLAAMRFEEPPDMPFSWGFGPNEPAKRSLRADVAPRGVDWDRFQFATEDVLFLHAEYTAPLPPHTPAYMGIWGIETRAVDYGAGVYEDEIARNPLADLEEIGQLEDHPWPSPDNFDYASIARLLAEKDPDKEKAIRLKGGNPFEIYAWMVGLEDALMHLVSDPELVEAGMARIASVFKAIHEREVRVLRELGREVDLVLVMDDLGGQHGPLLSLTHYRDLIQPVHRDLCAHIRQLAPEAIIQYHSDGSVFDFLPDLMDAGVQCLEAVQVECARMDPERLAEAFGDRLRFQGAISVQQVLPFASPEAVRAECDRLRNTLGRGGGWLPAPSHAVQTGTPVENLSAMLDAIIGPERLEAAFAAAR